MNWFNSHIAAWFVAPFLALSALFGMHSAPAIIPPVGTPIVTATSSGSTTPSPATPNQPVACTMEAMQCPDGSWVGRSGPKCEFAKCPAPQPAVSSITIYSMKPTSGPVGTHVVIDGFGFTNDNTIHFGSGVIVHVPITSSIAIACTTDPNCKGGIHQTIEFDVPSGLTPACFYSEPRCMVLTRLTTPGDYKVSVTNVNGTSTSVTFTVTGTTTAGLQVNSISPRSGVVGTSVTLIGSGFAANDIVTIGGGAITQTSVNSAGTTLTFTVPDAVGAYCAPGMMCPMYMRLLTPGSYDISVKNPGTDNQSNSVTFTITDGTTSGGGPLSVTDLDAPTSLALGQQGTWTVHVSVPSTVGQLHYSATWGDEANASAQIMAPQPQQIQTSASFTHAYSRSGTYTATFTVSDDQGRSVSTSAQILVTPLY